MFERLFDLPLLIIGPASLVVLGAFALLGLVVVRRWVLPRLRTEVQDSEFVGAMVQAVMVFYGLAVALMAVSVWQTYADVSRIVSAEATAIAALYRDVSTYPEPVRSHLQTDLRDYVDYIITEAWPLQRQGQVPAGGVALVDRFQAELAGFEPASESQKAMHAETLSAYNRMIQARRLRLDAVGTGLPSVLWFVIVAGAFISLSTTFFFRVQDARLHATLVTLLATFIALVIFMILSLDRPFRGDLGLPPTPYQLIYDQLMKP